MEDKYKCDEEIIRLATVKDLKSIDFEELFSKSRKTFKRLCDLNDLSKFIHVGHEPKLVYRECEPISKNNRFPCRVQTEIENVATISEPINGQESQNLYFYSRVPEKDVGKFKSLGNMPNFREDK